VAACCDHVAVTVGPPQRQGSSCCGACGASVGAGGCDKAGAKAACAVEGPNSLGHLRRRLCHVLDTTLPWAASARAGLTCALFAALVVLLLI
jgi:hypothetical protein